MSSRDAEEARLSAACSALSTKLRELLGDSLHGVGYALSTDGVLRELYVYASKKVTRSGVYLPLEFEGYPVKYRLGSKPKPCKGVRGL